MPRRKGLSYAKGTGICLDSLFTKCIWRQQEYVLRNVELLNLATDFKQFIQKEYLSKLSLHDLQSICAQAAWNAVLNYEDVSLSFKKQRNKDKSSKQPENTLERFFKNNVQTILKVIKNKIVLIVDPPKLELLLVKLSTYVWFNCSYQCKCVYYPKASSFLRRFRRNITNNKSEDTMQLCADSLWNCIMYKALGNVIKNIETEDVEFAEIKDSKVDLDVEDINVEPTSISQTESHFTKSLPVVPADTKAKESLKRTLIKDVLLFVSSSPSKPPPQEFSMKVPFPLDCIAQGQCMPLSMKPILKLETYARGCVKISWSIPYYMDNVIVFEVFMLKKFKLDLDLQKWTKISLIKVDKIPMPLYLEGLTLDVRYYFTVRVITDNNQFSLISDIKFIIL